MTLYTIAYLLNKIYSHLSKGFPKALETKCSEASTSAIILSNIESPEVIKNVNDIPSTGIRLSKNSDSTTSSSSYSVHSCVNNNNDDKMFEAYFHDLNEAIGDSLNGVIDWTITAAREMALQDMCQFKEYGYTPECKSLVDRLSGEDKPVLGWRSELLKDHEFKSKQFHPLKHQDWAYVKFITEHL